MDSNIDHPSYYTTGKIEVIDFIEDQNLPFHLGNAIKYICRAGKKDPAKTEEDLQKAIWYLNRYIEHKVTEKDGKDNTWIPKIIRKSPDYICPYCGNSAGTIYPGKYCDKCGEEVGSSNFKKDFIYSDNAYMLKVSDA